MNDPLTKPVSKEQIRQIISTKNGPVAIAQSETGIPVQDYFANQALPDRMWNQVVYETESGPAVVERSSEPWNERHDQRAQQIAETLHAQIDERGFYVKTLQSKADNLAQSTDRTQRQCFETIINKYVATYGTKPKVHVEAWRMQRGLPVRGQENSLVQTEQPEL